MEEKMKNEMENRAIQGLIGIRISKIGGTMLGVLIIWNLVFWGIYLGPLTFGKLPRTYQLGFGVWVLLRWRLINCAQMAQPHS